jgi:hypothetical protein
LNAARLQNVPGFFGFQPMQQSPRSKLIGL